jgi:hypothetical protein
MGKGLALEFKKRFPDMYKDYAERCKKGEVRLGRPYLYKNLVTPWILLFPTKQDWRSVSKLSDIEEGLKYLEKNYKDWGITSLAVPPWLRTRRIKLGYRRSDIISLFKQVRNSR